MPWKFIVTNLGAHTNFSLITGHKMSLQNLYNTSLISFKHNVNSIKRKLNRNKLFKKN